MVISREDGSPVCAAGLKPIPVFLTDENQILTVRKNGGTVETACGGIAELLAFTARLMKDLDVKERRKLCEAYGVDFRPARKN